MKRIACSTAAVLALVLGAIDHRMQSGLMAAVAGEHDYFNSLTRRADVFKQYSLRDPAQLASRQLGGYAQGPADQSQWVTYNPNADTDRHRQDAAKVVVPAFDQVSVLTQPVAANSTVLTLDQAYKPNFPRDRIIKVEREVMIVTGWLTDTTIGVTRGQYSTAAASHSAGATLGVATNSLPSQVRLPLGTADGNTYFFTWDSYWTDSYVGAGGFNHKAFQFSSGSRDGDAIWLEPDATYSADRHGCFDQSKHVAAFSVRSYNRLGGVANWLLTDGNSLGPIVTSPAPLGPRAEYCVEPNRWVRFFVSIRQRASDYDYVDMWIADEGRDPIQTLMNVPVSVRPDGPTPHSIAKFWLEFNSSVDDYYRLDSRDLVAYVRNFVALKNPADIRSLLIRPLPGAEAVSGPSAPRNVRIIQGS